MENRVVNFIGKAHYNIHLGGNCIWGKNNKNQKIVDFSIENLDLSKYVIGYKKHGYVYDLYGICNHSGSVHGGHYTAYVKNANDKWYCFNDTTVTEINETLLISSKAYCYCYRKII